MSHLPHPHRWLLTLACLAALGLLAACNSTEPDPLTDAGPHPGADKGADSASNDGPPPAADSHVDGHSDPSWGCPFPYTTPQKRSLPGNDAGISTGPTEATDVHVRCKLLVQGEEAEVLVKAEPVAMGPFMPTYEAKEAYLCLQGTVTPLTEFFYDNGGRHGWSQMSVTHEGRRYTFGYSETCVGFRPCTPFPDEYDVVDTADESKISEAVATICAGVGPGGVPQPLVPQLRIQTGAEGNVAVPFSMGSAAGDADEQPVHEMDFIPVRVDQREATNGELALFLSDHGNDCDGHPCAVADAPNLGVEQDSGIWRAKQGLADHPAVQVTWFGANAYCRWRLMKLPSEVEWEAAASAVGQRAYPWGDDAPSCERALHDQCSSTAPDLPCSHPQGNSVEGLCDLGGNLAEWVGDWYKADFYLICSTSDFESCWQGPFEDTGLKVIRGGSFARPAHNLRAADRDSAAPATGAEDLGLRCVSGNPS